MNLANIITCMRILGTVLLLFTAPFSDSFFVIYTLAGFSDVFDGYVARKTNTTSELGSKLDSVADLLFYTVMAFKIIPEITHILPVQIWYIINVIVVLRIFTYVYTALRYGKFMSNHTRLNKLTGFFVFLIPYFFEFTDFAVYICGITCLIAVFAAVNEWLFYLRKRQ